MQRGSQSLPEMEILKMVQHHDKGLSRSTFRKIAFILVQFMEYRSEIGGKSVGHGSLGAECISSMHEELGSISQKQLEDTSKEMTAQTDEVANTTEKNDTIVWIWFLGFPQGFTQECCSQMETLRVGEA